MDVFKFQKWLDEVTGPCCNNIERDIHYRYIMELCRADDQPLEIAKGMVVAALAMMLAHDQAAAETDFKRELEVIAAAIGGTAVEQEIRRRTREIQP